MFFSEGVVFHSPIERTTKREREKGDRENSKRGRDRERETHTCKMCGVLYVDRVLPEENKEDSWKRFNIPIIYKMMMKRRRKRRRRNGKDD